MTRAPSLSPAPKPRANATKRPPPRALPAAKEALRFQAALLDAVGEAVIAVDLQGVVVYWNRAAEEMYGWSSEEAIGALGAELLAYDETSGASASVAEAVTAGRTWSGDVDVTARDGKRLRASVTTTPVFGPSGALMAVTTVSSNVTARREEERLAQLDRRRLTEAQALAQAGSFEFDLETESLSWSPEVYRMMGLSPASGPDEAAFFGLVHELDRPALREAWGRAVTSGAGFEQAYRITRPDGTERHLRTKMRQEVDADGRKLSLTGIVLDETDRIDSNRARREAEARFLQGFEQAAVGIAITDLDGDPIDVNPAFCALLGRAPPELVGQSMSRFTHAHDVPLNEAVQAALAAGSDTHRDERRYVRPDGTIVWASANVNLVRDENGQPHYFFVQLENITERIDAEAELVHQAMHDPLTGLPNRAMLADRITSGLAGCRRRGSQLAVMVLDVDHLKGLNDSAGHAAGDDALVRVADCITESLRPGDGVVRLGADEFEMVCDDLSAVEAVAIAERIVRAVRGPEGQTPGRMPLSVSIGIALSDGEATPETLRRDADAAVYRAKARGRGRVELFDLTLRTQAERRMATQEALGLALEREEFVVHYQPIIDMATSRIVGAEALVRWNHPERGLVGPDEFIGNAEETGQIIRIGEWVLGKACGELAGWQRTDPSLSVAVNMSVRQLGAPGVARMVQDALRRSAVKPGDLCLEVTESVLIDDVEYFGWILAQLKAIGVRLSVDDFGTGYSSLTYLKRFPFDEVKIDRGFVDGLGDDEHDSALVAGILALADALHLEVTAEGVETVEQLTHLRRMACHRTQGYYLARPMPAADMARLIEEQGPEQHPKENR